jgi:hypothetical protein
LPAIAFVSVKTAPCAASPVRFALARSDAYVSGEGDVVDSPHAAARLAAATKSIVLRMLEFSNANE